MKCKQCASQVDPAMERCPQCGAEVEQAEAGKNTSGKVVKIIKIVVSSILVLALLCAMVLVVWKDDLIPGYWFSEFPGSIPKNGNPDNVTSKGTYTASLAGLKWHGDTVVAQYGDEVLTNGHLAIIYTAVKVNIINGHNDLSAMKLDPKVPLDRQPCTLQGYESLTWQQCFLQEALEEWKGNALLCKKAKDAGFKLADDKQQKLDNLYNQLHKDYVESGMYASVEEVLADCYGPGCTYEDYLTYTTTSTIAAAYYKQMLLEAENTAVTEAEIEAYFEDQEEYLAKYDIKKDDNIVVDVRHILVTIERASQKDEQFEESDWEKARVLAQEILDEWLAGEATQESFAELAEKYSEDPGSYNNGGLYTDVKKGKMAEPFENWCFDASRQIGDYGLVRTDYGYHVMYYVGSEAYWHYISAKNVPTWRVNELLQTQRDAMDAQIKYRKISLWESAYYED